VKIFRSALITVPLAVCLASLCGWQWHRRELRRGELRRSAEKSNQLAGSIDLLTAELSRTKKEQAGLRRKLAAAAQKPAVQSVPKISDNLRIERDPALHAIFAQVLRNALGPRWGPLFARLHLSPAEIDRFKTIETNYELSHFDLMTSFQAAGGGPDTTAYQQEKAAEKSTFGAAMQQLFGDRFSEYSSYPDTLGVRPVTTALAIQLNDSAPLSAVQADRLTQVLAAASKPESEDQSAADSVDWSTALEQARPLLQPAQFSALEGVARKSEADKKVQQSLVSAGLDRAQILQINAALK